MESEKCYAKMQDGSVLYYEKIGKGKPLSYCTAMAGAVLTLLIR